jgi:hypothetical protein
LNFRGLLLSEITALVIAQRRMLVGGLLVLFADTFDMFEGAMAQVLNTAQTSVLF